MDIFKYLEKTIDNLSCYLKFSEPFLTVLKCPLTTFLINSWVKTFFLDGYEWEIFELDFSIVRIASAIEREVEIQTDRVCYEFILA
jgi:hypothetical protein